jgi:hypothetical protein
MMEYQAKEPACARFSIPAGFGFSAAGHFNAWLH